MEVELRCTFIVESVEGEELTENEAKSAASLAAWNHLTLIENSGQSTDVESVVVHVDGFGKCKVSLGEEHE